MKGKRGFSYAIVLVLLAVIVLAQVVHAALLSDVATCNSDGGIWCGPLTVNPAIACLGKGPEDYSGTKDCTVSINQNVTLDKNWARMTNGRLNEYNLKTYTFNSFTVTSLARLQFYNTLYPTVGAPKAADANCASTATSEDSTRFLGMGNCPAYHNYGGSAKWTGDTISKGGSGGNGGERGKWVGCNYWAGGGGAGAGGGVIGASGGDGRKAGSNTEYSGAYSAPGGSNCGGLWTAADKRGMGGEDGGRGGGFVKIVANTITINADTVISVDGDPGQNGKKGGGGSKYGGDGGGPGSGGGGAGKIILSYKDLKGTGKLSANGGNGGNGGAGGEGKDANGGSGGGGGGGQGGVIGLALLDGGSPNPQITIDISECSKGKGGLAGTVTGDGSSGKNGTDGKDGLCGDRTEMDPDPKNSGNPNYNLCSNGIDDEGDSMIDMEDMDCRNLPNWDASIYANYPDKSVVNYDKSAKNGRDLACGDDLGTCNTMPNDDGTCEKIPDVDICKTKKCTTVNNEQYNCGCDYGEGEFGYVVYSACTEEDTGSMSIPNDPFGYTYTTIDTSICRENDYFDCSYYSTRSYCEDYYSQICQWINTPPILNCADYWGEQACNEQKEYGCYWTDKDPGTADLGFLTSDNQYLCLNSWDGNNIVTPKNKYAWFGADGTIKNKPIFSDTPYTIFQADKTQFISNGAEWFQCGATGIIYTNTNNISEYKTFRGKSASGLNDCVDTLNEIAKKESTSYGIATCTTTPNTCDINCNNNESCRGWCYSNKEYGRGEFEDICGYSCKIKIDEELIDLSDFIQSSTYAGSPFKTSFCELNPFESDCFKGFNTLGNSSSNSNVKYMDQIYCKKNPALCGKGVDSSSKYCRDLHLDTGYPYSRDEDKLCEKTDYCDGGYLVQTADSDSSIDKYCCYGANSYCKKFEMANCGTIGGEVKPASCDNCGCTGIQKEDCCIEGNWIDLSVLDINVNESFICYKEEGDAMIRECCGIAGCYNKDNQLNGGASLSGNTYSMDGVPLHSLVSFDNSKVSGTGTETSVRSYYNRDTTNRNLLRDLDIELTGRLLYGEESDWANFKYLEFDIMYNNIDVNYELLLQNGSANPAICYYNISDYISVKKGPLRWQHVTVDISNLKNCNSSTSLFGPVKDINILITGPPRSGINVLVDNFFLRSRAGNAVNSKNMFCSGNWGDWVENLDGPDINDDTGFYGKTPAPELVEYGPFRDACDGVISFGWTGNVCCGDDTKSDNYGEYWIDSQGICWNGTTVYNDVTIADALGLSPFMAKWADSMNERSLLFYNNELLSCNRPKSNYGSYLVSFNGTATAEKLVDEITEVDPYTIRGSWFCEEGKGWVNMNDVNKVRLLVSSLQGIAAARGGDYTLMCGPFLNTVNTFGTLWDTSNMALTGSTCVLRLGNNKYETNGNEEIIVGLETLASYDTYKNDVLAKYTLFNINPDSDDCASSPMDVNSGEFFKHCATDSNNDFYVYYNGRLGLMLVSSGKINAPGIENSGFLSFLQNIWAGFKNFLSNLFGSGQNELNPLGGFESSKDFYISVQKNSEIMGSIEDVGSNISLRVDYLNITTNVSLLSDAVHANYPAANVTYTKSADGKNQSIYVTSAKIFDKVDWRLITSILRLNP